MLLVLLDEWHLESLLEISTEVDFLRNQLNLEELWKRGQNCGSCEDCPSNRCVVWFVAFELLKVLMLWHNLLGVKTGIRPVQKTAVEMYSRTAGHFLTFWLLHSVKPHPRSSLQHSLFVSHHHCSANIILAKYNWSSFNRSSSWRAAAHIVSGIDSLC